MSFSHLSKCDYSSEFSDVESEADAERAVIKRQKDELLVKNSSGKMGLFISSGKMSLKKPPSKHTLTDELDRQEGKRMRYHGILAMDAYARHQKFVNDYLAFYCGKREDFKQTKSTYVTDKDIITQNNKFLWEEEEESGLTWEKKLAKRYWNKLFKEYAIADLSRFKENKIALRWRIEKEVVTGKGQFLCGNKHCSEKDGLRSWEVNFAYMEIGEKKNALVKLRLCSECSYKLNYHHKRKEAKKKRKIHEQKKHEAEIEGLSKPKILNDETTGSKLINKKLESERQNEDDIEKKIWSQPVKVDQEKSRDDEFDKYFEDMLL